MSIRIQNDGISAPATSQTVAAESAGRTGSSTRTGAGANSGGDQVDLSSLSGNIAASSSALANQQSARVSQLTALYSRGQFSVDSAQLSRALVNNSLGVGSAEGNN